MEHKKNRLHLKYLGIDTYKEAVIYMREDCNVCRSEGFEVHARVHVSLNGHQILATINTISNGVLMHGEASLSKYAWELLDAKEDDEIKLSHPKPLNSLSFVRSKVYGNTLQNKEITEIIKDISSGNYTDIHIATFLTACAGGRLDDGEIVNLTRSMIDVGEKLSWASDIVVDKHCVGGLPGNRTTLVVVPIVTAFGMTMPKTSSRAITSPAGTADTMEAITSVDLNISAMRKVVEQENGCIVWGGSVALSPADDILIRVERAMDLDSKGQLIASVLSKKIAAGSTNVVIDIPVGFTAKIRSMDEAKCLERIFKMVADRLNIQVKINISDGSQPVGYGIGPALEARDVLNVLQNIKGAPQDLRNRSLDLAGKILEFSPSCNVGEGRKIAETILLEGKAWEKFQAICDAQGGMKEIPTAPYTNVVSAVISGQVIAIDNRLLSKLAKLAGAPQDKVAGVTLHTRLHESVKVGQPLFTIHAESKGELRYALSFLEQVPPIFSIEESE